MQTQKQAVTNAVLSVFKDYELGGETTLKSILTSETKKQIQSILFEGFKGGKVSLSADAQKKYSGDDAALLKYSNGMLDNWIRKNPEFNAGQKYVTKNPGSRAGSGDEQIRAMRALRKQTTDTTALAEIDKAIAERLAEIKPAKSAAPIDVEKLPQHLRHLVGGSSES